MPRAGLLPLAALATVLAACGDAPAAPSAAPHAVAVRAARVIERPWKGRCDVESVFTSATTQRITGSCQLAHLGRVTVETEEALTSATTGVNTSTYTASNGDQLYATGSVVATFGPDGGVALAGTWTAAGGTGRFARARGTAAYTGAAQFTGPASAAGAYTLEGQLAY